MVDGWTRVDDKWVDGGERRKGGCRRRRAALVHVVGCVGGGWCGWLRLGWWAIVP